MIFWMIFVSSDPLPFAGTRPAGGAVSDTVDVEVVAKVLSDNKSFDSRLNSGVKELMANQQLITSASLNVYFFISISLYAILNLSLSYRPLNGQNTSIQ